MQIALVSTSPAVARVRATVRSAFHVAPDSTVYVLDLDGNYLPVGTEQVLTPQEVAVAGRDHHLRAILLEPADLIRWMQPALLRHALLTSSTVLAVSPGVLFLGDPSDLSDIASEQEVCLLPRNSQALPIDGAWPRPADLLASGSYTPHLLAVSRGATAFVDLWEEMAADPRTASDRWLDVAASHISHHTVHAARFLISAWTAPSARIGEAPDGTLEVDGAAAVAVDLTGLDPDLPWMLAANPHHPPRVLLSAYPGLARLASRYAADARRDAAAPRRDSVGTHQPAESLVTSLTTSLGVPVHAQLREVFRAALQESPSRSIDALPDPFDEDSIEELEAWLIQPAGNDSDLGLGRYLASIYRSRPDLHTSFPRVPDENVEALLRWADEHGRHEAAYSRVLIDLTLGALHGTTPEPSPAPTPGKTTPAVRRAGVNLVGYLRGELGVGESARLMLSALTAAGVPHSTTSVDRHLQSRQGARYVATATDEPFDTTLLCVNADMTSAVAASVPSLLQPSYRIGMWYWEVENFPPSQHKGFGHVDEIWVASDFVLSAIEPHSPVPVRTMTPPLPRPRHDPGRTRAKLGLPDRPYFLFSFDFLSNVERKNPWGLIDAFQAAFATGEGPMLVIKSINAERQLRQAERLRLRAAGASDVLLLEDYFDAADRDALMALCDCYVSLHRSEGLGLTMAEAMALGKPVIATGYSGNLQFMTDENSFLVPWTPTSIPTGCEPYPPGGTWAEPDLEAAARLMRTVLDNGELAATRGRKGAEDLRILHSPEAAGRIISARVAEIRDGRPPERRPGARDQLRALARRTLRS